MLIYGITGYINYGKSTLAAALSAQVPHASRHFESFLVVAEVANALNNRTTVVPDRDDLTAINRWLEPLSSIVAETVHAHVSIDQIMLKEDAVKNEPEHYAKLFKYIESLHAHPILLRQPITHDNKEDYRPLLQWLGGYLVAKIGPGVWYDEIIRRVQQAEQAGCQLCTIDGLRYPYDAKLVRDAGGVILEITRPFFTAVDTRDITERDRDNIQADVTIVNDGTLDELKQVAVQVVADSQAKVLQLVYHCRV